MFRGHHVESDYSAVGLAVRHPPGGAPGAAAVAGRLDHLAAAELRRHAARGEALFRAKELDSHQRVTLAGARPHRPRSPGVCRAIDRTRTVRAMPGAVTYSAPGVIATPVVAPLGREPEPDERMTVHLRPPSVLRSGRAVSKVQTASGTAIPTPAGPAALSANR